MVKGARPPGEITRRARATEVSPLGVRSGSPRSSARAAAVRDGRSTVEIRTAGERRMRARAANALVRRRASRRPAVGAARGPQAHVAARESVGIVERTHRDCLGRRRPGARWPAVRVAGGGWRSRFAAPALGTVGASSGTTLSRAAGVCAPVAAGILGWTFPSREANDRVVSTNRGLRDEESKSIHRVRTGRLPSVAGAGAPRHSLLHGDPRRDDRLRRLA